jgi:hypothetical protein
VAGLLASLVVPATAPAMADQPANPRVICREVLPTGTFTRKAMICMSETAWGKGRADRRREDDYSQEPLLDLKTPAVPEALQIGSANWDKLPPLQVRHRAPYLQLVSMVREALRKGECVLPGQKANKFDIDVRYAAMVGPDGKASRYLIDDTKCPMLNTIVGMAALARSERGDFAPTGEAKARWFVDRMNFTLK